MIRLDGVFEMSVSLMLSVFFRKHSCGEQEVCTLPSPPLHHTSDDSNQVLMTLWGHFN